MKDQILDIINSKPRHYTRIIKNDPVLHNWVMSNTQSQNIDNYPELIYSAINNESPVCKYGRTRKLTRFANGYDYCGHQSKCKCSAESTSREVSKKKLQYSAKKKQEIKKKREKTMIERYGVAYNSQRENVKPYKRLTSELYEKLENRDYLYREYVLNKRSLVDIANELGIYYGTVGWYVSKHGFKIRRRSNYSLIEKEIYSFILELGITAELSNWYILQNKEIDIYVPDFKFGIEVNGLYWHSNDQQSTDKMRHLNKTIEANANGVDLIHVTDYEWNNKQDIVKSIIRNRLNKTTKIYARKCNIKTVNTSEERAFLDQNHIQGYVPSKFAVGLYYNNDLVSLMSIGKSRFNSDYEYELLRYCSLLDHTVVGGGSKLLKYLNTPMITYCQRDLFNGNGYTAMGFEFVRHTEPGFYWTDGNIIISRFKVQKQKLAKWLPEFDPLLSQDENMFNNGYRKYWNCGNIVYAFNLASKSH